MNIKLRTTFQILSFLMAVLMFNAPFITPAQQSPVQAEAIAAAERDASNDLNKPLWFIMGMSPLIGGYVGLRAGSSIDSGGGGLGPLY